MPSFILFFHVNLLEFCELLALWYSKCADARSITLNTVQAEAACFLSCRHVRARTRQWQAHRKPAIGLSQLFEPHSTVATVAHRWRGADRSASLRGDATWCGIAVEGAGGDLVVVHLEGDEKSDRSGRSHFMTGNVHPQTCSDSVTSFMAFMASCSWGCSANLHCTESKALVPSGAAANFPHGPGWFRMNCFFEHIRCCVTKRWWELNFPSSRRMHFNCCHCKRSLVRHCFPSWNPVRVQIWSWSRCVVKGPTDQRVVSKCSKQNVGRPEFWLKLFLNQTSWDLPNLQRSHGYRVPFPVPLGLHESWKNVTRCQFFHSLQTKVTKDSRGKSWGSFFCAIFDCNVCACLEQHPHVAWHRGVHRPSHRGRHGCQCCCFHVYWARGIPCQQGKHIGFHICCCIVDVEIERYSAENITKDERNGSQAKMVCQTASISWALCQWSLMMCADVRWWRGFVSTRPDLFCAPDILRLAYLERWQKPSVQLLNSTSSSSQLGTNGTNNRSWR